MGKTFSLGAKFISVFFVIGGFFFFVWQSKTITPEQAKALVYIGLFIGLIFAPIDISFWLEKFVKMFNGGGSEKND
ncbi:hypothetical protein [Thermospira aquatica]|uniref:Uncharacterized protein n=1 Tax=Thermospira aquatica TaxID=2828656 RepID=A0AAX3BDY7_9SPIR|nr:hypothetical protein [Thermospira aquatica]URA10544.1 hypothetical protein KDW03_01710 [Thermospira aquatica]